MRIESYPISKGRERRRIEDDLVLCAGGAAILGGDLNESPSE